MKLLCSLTRQGKNCEMSSSTLVSVCQVIRRLYASISSINYYAHYNLAFDKCFSICEVVIVKSFCITFLIHKTQFAFQVHA